MEIHISPIPFFVTRFLTFPLLALHGKNQPFMLTRYRGLYRETGIQKRIAIESYITPFESGRNPESFRDVRYFRR